MLQLGEVGAGHVITGEGQQGTGSRRSQLIPQPGGKVTETRAEFQNGDRALAARAVVDFRQHLAPLKRVMGGSMEDMKVGSSGVVGLYSIFELVEL